MKQMKIIAKSLLVLLLLVSCHKQSPVETLNLAGEWTFKADPADKGLIEKWYNSGLTEIVGLPGSMAENNKGEAVGLETPWTGSIVDSSWFTKPEMEIYRKPGNIKVPFWLQPEKYFTGMAWYQKKVKIPAAWEEKNIQLFLERCHWETRVWIDGQEAGKQNSLGTPHIYDLTHWLTPGNHNITVCVDNRVKEIDVGINSHSISDHTQSNWNGMAGRLELQARSAVHIADVKLFPDIHRKMVTVRLTLNNSTKDTGRMKVEVRAVRERGSLPLLFSEIMVRKGLSETVIDYPMGENPLLWDEFEPNLYQMQIGIKGLSGRQDSRSITFGMREFKTQGTQFTINGRPLFLRGTLECAIFPNTGYPATDTASWMRIFRIARAHGLNHMRFHSWCPPEAAFTAADHAGFYLHVECSSWANQGASIGDGTPLDKFIYDESERIVNSYGNHPSFCMMLYGNEPAGANLEKWLAEFVTWWKKKDARRLYSSGAGWPILLETDFNSTALPRIQGWGQGLNSIINAQPPSTDYDWKNIISEFNKPTVSHEIGQWCAYPDFKETSQYTGVLKPKNFEIFRESLQKNNLLQLADSFLLASGKLQTLCYKADIEAALRTPGFGGFQLLDLHDFPGQGTALVGVLNAFWNSKGYVTAKDYSRFCNATVPLLRLPKMIYYSGEMLKASVEVAHFGQKVLADIIPEWKITDTKGLVRFAGKLPRTTIPIGNNNRLGEIAQSLSLVSGPEKLTITVNIGTYANDWDIWVYPAELSEIAPDILVTAKMDARALKLLELGGKVLLTIKKGSVKPEKGGSIAVGFSSIFWNTAWTGGQPPHTLGILCNPKHKALASFPTEFHSNWQWWDAMSHSNALILSDFPADLRPIVRIIDDWFTNRPLALIFEAKIGKGKIIVCGVDLFTDAEKRPEARQLLYSLKSYMTGGSFYPTTEIETEKLRAMFIQ